MKKNDGFIDIDILKERQRLKMLKQELKIKAEFRELGEHITGGRLRHTIQDNLIGGQGLAIKLGFLAFSLITDRIRRRRKK